jgi:hypothetical protein
MNASRSGDAAGRRRLRAGDRADQRRPEHLHAAGDYEHGGADGGSGGVSLARSPGLALMRAEASRATISSVAETVLIVDDHAGFFADYAIPFVGETNLDGACGYLRPRPKKPKMANTTTTMMTIKSQVGM